MTEVYVKDRTARQLKQTPPVKWQTHVATVEHNTVSSHSTTSALEPAVY